MRKPKVLVVDDDAFSRTVVAKKIAKLAEVVEAEDGQNAMSHLSTSGVVDLAIVDLEMPNINGVELIRQIRSQPALKHIPIIVLTANETRGGLENALMAGATSFLLKPLNWDAFGEHIRHILELAYRAGHMALHDALTGLPNRVLLNERLEHALSFGKAELDRGHIHSRSRSVQARERYPGTSHGRQAPEDGRRQVAADHPQHGHGCAHGRR